MLSVVPIYEFQENLISTVDSQVRLINVSISKVNWGSYFAYLIVLVKNDNIVELYPSNTENSVNLLNSDQRLSFISIDFICKAQHCLNGNFIVTLEHVVEFNTYYLRIFVNWNTLESAKDAKIITKSRIANKVTPSTNSLQNQSLEMIHLLLDDDFPNDFECCQSSGNILVLCGNHKTLKIFEFQIRQNDILKVDFIDFRPLMCTLGLSIKPLSIGFSENYIFYHNIDYLHVFQLFKKETDFEVAKEFQENNYFEKDTEIKFEELKLKSTKKFSKIEYSNHVICKSYLITFDNLKLEIDNSNIIVNNLMNIKLESNDNGFGIEKVKFKPFYVKNNTYLKPFSNQQSPLIKSENWPLLNHIKLLFLLKQEIYLYQFFNEEPKHHFTDYCIGEYPLTGSIRDFVFNDYCLYVANNNGLETFSLNYSKKISKKLPPSKFNFVQNKFSEFVSMIGFNTFYGVQNLFISSPDYLYLIAEDAGKLTIYRLKLMNFLNLLNEIVKTVKRNEVNSPQMSHQLMMKVRQMSKMNQLFLYLKQIECHVIPTVYLQEQSNSEVCDVFKESSFFLASNFIRNVDEKHKKAIYGYFKMSEANVNDFLNTILDKYQNKKIENLLDFLTDYYGKNDERIIMIRSEGNLIEHLLEYDKERFVEALLRMSSFRHALSNKIMKFLETSAEDDSNINLLSCVICIEKQYENMHNCILENQHINIQNLESYPELLFEIRNEININFKVLDFESFSDFALIILDNNPVVFIKLLCNLVEKRHFISFSTVLKLLCSAITTKLTIGNWKLICEFLEMVFEQNDDLIDDQSLKILIRFYLQELLSDKLVQNEKMLCKFLKYRFQFLDKLEPFITHDCFNLPWLNIVKKLQAVLCKKNSSKDIQKEIRNFLENDDKLTNIHLSLKTIIYNIEEIYSGILIEKPSIMMDFLKDRLNNDLLAWKQFMPTLNHNFEIKIANKQNINEILDYLFHEFSLKELSTILPNGLLRIFLDCETIHDVNCHHKYFVKESEIKSFLQINEKESNIMKILQNRYQKALYLKNQKELIFQLFNNP